MAVRAYLDDPLEGKDSDGWSYMVVYGILQALYVQQDAALMLAKRFKLALTLPDEIQKIRKIRNHSIGHPAGNGAFISRITLSTDGFQLLVPIEGGKTDIQHVSVRAVAEAQISLMGAFLDTVVERLVTDELEHRREFRGQRLQDALPSNKWGYALEKIGEGLDRQDSIPFGLFGIDSLRRMLQEFHELLDKRGLTTAYEDSIGRVSLEISGALERIESRLNGGQQEWTALDRNVYWSFLSEKLGELQGFAGEIDEDYASDTVP